MKPSSSGLWFAWGFHGFCVASSGRSVQAVWVFLPPFWRAVCLQRLVRVFQVCCRMAQHTVVLSTLLKTFVFLRYQFLKINYSLVLAVLDFPGGSDGKESACNAGNLGSIPGWGRSPGGGQCNPLQYSHLENLTDRGVWWATVHAVTELDTPEGQRTVLGLPRCPGAFLPLS